VVSSRIVGEHHLKIALRERGKRRVFDAIGFRKAEQQPRVGASIDVAFTPEIGLWDGYQRLQLLLRDLRESTANSAG